jgi:hypothetical protein
MLAAAGALVFFLVVSLQSTMWHMTALPSEESHDFPRAWYAILVLIAACFFGGHRGWTDISPVVKRLYDYRAEHWGPNSPPHAPSRESEDTWIH